MPTFSIEDDPEFYKSARDAIDAVSAFEAETLATWEYRIESDGAEHWFVRVNRIDDDQPRTRGYLATKGVSR